LDSIDDFVIDEEVVEVFEVDIDLVGVFVLKGLLLIFGEPEIVCETLIVLVPKIVSVPKDDLVEVLDCETDFVPEKELRSVIEISGLNEGLDEIELEDESEKIEEKVVDFDGLIDRVADKEFVAVNVFKAENVLELISLILPVGDNELSLVNVGDLDITDEEL